MYILYFNARGIAFSIKTPYGAKMTWLPEANKNCINNLHDLTWSLVSLRSKAVAKGHVCHKLANHDFQRYD